MESIESNKDLLALHNGAWTVPDNNREPLPVGQDKIVRIFTELMRNMARMKTYIRPSMCKPYGKQSESLQKSKKTHFHYKYLNIRMSKYILELSSTFGYNTNCTNIA